MAFNFSPKIVIDGLVLYVDAANRYSYRASSTWFDLSAKNAQNVSWGITPTYTNQFAGAYLFDGVLTQFGTTDTPLIQTSPNLWTIDGWIKPSSSGNNDALISPSANGSDQKITCSSTNINVEICSGLDTNVRNRTVTEGITLDKWFNFSISIDNLEILIYINGILRGTWNETFSIAGWSGIWNIGRRSTGTLYYNGYLANLKVYSRKLAGYERLQNYNATKSRFGL